MSQLLKLIFTKKTIINKQYKNIIKINKITLSNFFVFEAKDEAPFGEIHPSARTPNLPESHSKHFREESHAHRPK